MRRRTKDLTPVLVIWHDAHADAGTWTRDEEADAEPCVVRSVGFLLNGWKRKHLCIAQSVEGEFRDSVLAIPNGMVQQVITLTETDQ